MRTELFPGEQNVRVSREGFYPQNFDVVISRWDSLEKEVLLERIPTLEPYSQELPVPELPEYELITEGQEVLLSRVEDGETLARFQTLQDPC